MISIPVTASRNYCVKIGSGILPCLASEIHQLTKATRVAVISDSHVWPLYGESVQTILSDSGLEVCSYVFPAGENSKSGDTFLKILNFLAENRISRSDCLIALGGGVVGDLTGFAAACYLRGVAYIQIPTTLLAAVDSSVGGKTGIDLPAGKNLAGAFHPPCLVLCDTDTLQTLPEDIFRDGCAEVIKYGILYDKELFNRLLGQGLSFDRESVIARCVELKRDVVALDEYDTGLRMKLNLGHTIGHSVEAASHFQISHGKAVAIGTAVITRAGCKAGICSQETKDHILRILEVFGLPTRTDYSAQQLLTHALSDKKRTGETLRLILPKDIGECIIFPMETSALYAFIQEGL